MDEQSIKETVNKALAEEFELEPEAMTPEANLYEDLGLDSLDAVDMVIVLENAFGVKIRDEQTLRTIRTLNDIYEYIYQKKEPGSGYGLAVPLPCWARKAMTGKAPWGKALAATAYGAPALVLVTVGVLCFYPLVYAWKRLSAGWTGRRIARHFIWLYGRAWRVAFSPFVRFVVRMPAARDFPRPCIVVCNHLSVFDIYSMSLLPVSDVAMTVRSWPLSPFLEQAVHEAGRLP